MTGAGSPTRRELWLVLSLTLLGAVPRFWSFGRVGLTHFDEGVYALAGFWSIAPGGPAAIDPSVIPYAPPGFPILVGVCYAVFGLTDWSAVIVSNLCGVLAVPATAWVARRSFGPGAGAAAAAFAAASLPHVAFCRKALTDAPFLLAWLLALGLGGRFLERPGLARALLLGAAVGVAQNFKYNGWLVAPLVVLTAFLGAVRSADERRASSVCRLLGFGFVAALVAGLVYAPWFEFVQRHGGYAALMRHHRSYLGGLEAWWPHWNQQLAQSVALSGGPVWGVLTWTLAWAAGALSWGRGAQASGAAGGARGFAAGLIGGACVLGVLATAPWWLGLAWCPRLLRDDRPAPRLVGAWWLALTVLTPLYHPYARLWLPLQAAGWVIMAGLVSSLVASAIGHSPDRERVGPSVFVSPLVAVCLILGTAQQWLTGPHAIPVAAFFGPTDALREVVAELRDRPGVEPGEPIQVLGRRPLAFYLVVQRRNPIRVLPDTSPLRRAADGLVLLDDVLLMQEGDPEVVLSRLLAKPPGGPGWAELARWSEELDPVTRLDVDPSAAFGSWVPRRVEIRLLEPQTRAGPPEGRGSLGTDRLSQ
jgi:4-amino-4-deoxy-L-arabinose transferase-like glycosyltransferase